SFREHALIVSKAKALGVERLLFVGQEFYQHRDDEAEFYATTAEAKDAVASISDSFVLLKASRGMAFEKLLDVLSGFSFAGGATEGSERLKRTAIIRIKHTTEAPQKGIIPRPDPTLTMITTSTAPDKQ